MEPSNAPSPRRKTLTLKARVGRRVERGHLWVFSNEVQEVSGQPAPGDEVVIRDVKGRLLGMGLYSASSLIRARIYSRTLDESCDGALIARRLRLAREYRALPAGESRAYRLIHGEGDMLPGVVADVYGDPAAPTVVLQITTAAMDLRRDLLVEALRTELAPAVIIERSDMAVRELEGLAPLKQVLWGERPATPCEVHENGVRLLMDPLEGQKTGYFLDQAENRAAARPWFPGRRVLDMFCYVGGWSIVAAAAGAAAVTGVDSSRPALELAERARAHNGLAADKCRFVQADAFDFLRQAAREGGQYDVIVVDPPALAKSRRDVEQALRAYRELNLRALQALAPDGLLITCSCSHHVSVEDFHQMLVVAARDARADCSILHGSAQAGDHPIHLATPETAYLKCRFLRKRLL